MATATAPDYLRARYYDPATGQFISRDPAVVTTREPYAYVRDNPLNATDAVGLDQCRSIGNLACWGATPQDAGNELLYLGNLAYQHLTVGISGCPWAGCVTGGVQGGHAYVTGGGVGLLGKGPFVGYANEPFAQRHEKNVNGGMACGFGLSYSRGFEDSFLQSDDPSDYEVDVFPGLGAYSGAQQTIWSGQFAPDQMGPLPSMPGGW